MDIYKTALQEDSESESETLAKQFIQKNNLGKGFSKKPLDFFYYWYYNSSSEEKVSITYFKNLLPKGPFVSFNQEDLSVSKEEFRRLEFEYEKEKFRKKMRKRAKGKTRFI